jgi:UrcA family protein
MKTFIRIVALGALASVPLASAMPAAAAETHSIVVKYNDLDPASPTGAKTLYQRLSVAAWRVCRDLHSGGTPGLIARASCSREALDNAVRSANLPMLTALHQGATPDLTASR